MAQLTRACARNGMTALVTACRTPVTRCPSCQYTASWSTARRSKISSSSKCRWQQPYSTLSCCATPHIAATKSNADHQLPEDDWLQRSRLLVGADGLAKLAAVNVLLVGLGGVGSFTAEFLCRAGVGSMTIVDGDTVDTTNRNRQLPALKSTVGQLKTEVVAGRLRDINPEVNLTVKQEFLDPVRAAALVQEQQYKYVIDCIDSVAPKQALLLAGHTAGAKVVSSMGAGGRMDPSRVRLADISQTYNDAFAAVMRRGLRKAGVSNGITVVFSDELAKPASLALTQQQYKKSYFGTSSYIPALFGLYIASHVIRDVVDSDYKSPPGSSSTNSSSTKRASSNSSNSRQKHKGQKQQQQQQQQQQVQQQAQQPTSHACSDGSGNPEQHSQWQEQPQQNARDSGVGLAQTGAVGSEPQPAASETLSAGVHQPPQLAASQTELLTEEQRCKERRAQSQDVARVLGSFDKSQGTGMGFDGEGI